MNSVFSGDFQGQIYLDEIRDVLRDQRASVLIGSGFSRNARKPSPDSAPMPTWDQLGQALAERLGQNSDRSVWAVDPARLAQEYEDTLGRPALNDFLMKQVRDDEFEPGDAHRRLLNLPWRDVFTTNWDTLLERCSGEHHLGFQVLERPSALALVDPPRIVKLHGSFPACEPLIVTREDYRTYAGALEPLANLLRQALMETTFLLLGFSGKDPNFERWSGWVRDNLGEHAPRIYLAGWLRLRESERQSLLRRNIMAIDLALHPGSDSWPEGETERHELATEWILQSLESPPTYELQRWPEPYVPETRISSILWPTGRVEPSGPLPESWPERSVSGTAARLREIHENTAIWRHNRECYPNWLVLPFDAAPRMRALTDSWEQVIVKVLPESGDAVERLDVLRELVWRRETLLDPLLEELAGPLLEVFDDVDPHSRTVGGESRNDVDWETVTAQWKTVATYLVTSARQNFDRETFGLRVARLKPFYSGDHELRQRMHHEECLWALNRQEWKRLEELLSKWELSGEDHGWRLRKAALLIELGDVEEALRLIDEVIEAVRGWRSDPASMAAPSMEAWALWLRHLLAGDPFGPPYERWREFAPYRCDLLGDIRHHETAAAGPSDRPKSKPFELGTLPGKTISFSNVPGIRAKAALRAVRFSEVAGVPSAVFGRVQYAVGSNLLKAASDALRPYVPEWTARLTARCAAGASDEGLAKVFSRSGVAFLEQEFVHDLAERQRSLVEQALERLPPSRGGVEAEYWRARLGAAMEALSRCVVRLGPHEVEEVLELAKRLYGDARVTADLSFWDALRNLLQRSWEALPRATQERHVLDLLGLPIVGLDDFSVGRPVAKFREPAWILERSSDDRRCPAPARSEENAQQWRAVVDLLIRALEAGGEARERASGRLSVMAPWKRFTAAEESGLAAALWGSSWQQTSMLPENTKLRPWVFAKLPEPKSGVALERLRASWSDRHDWSQVGQEAHEKLLANAGDALAALRQRGVRVALTSDEVEVLRMAVERWAESDLHPVLPWEASEKARPRAEALYGVATLLLEFRVSPVAARALGQRVRQERDAETPAYQLTPGILRSDGAQLDALASLLRTGLASTVRAALDSAASGLFLWLREASRSEPFVPAVPEEVLAEIGVVLANRRWPSISSALQIAAWVYGDGSAEQRAVLRAPLLESLGRFIEELVYEEDFDQHPFFKRPWVDHEEVDVPLLRWRCAKLAIAMEAAGLGEEPVVARWIREAERDPLPEMRYIAEGWEG